MAIALTNCLPQEQMRNSSIFSKMWILILNACSSLQHCARNRNGIFPVDWRLPKQPWSSSSSACVPATRPPSIMRALFLKSNCLISAIMIWNAWAAINWIKNSTCKSPSRTVRWPKQTLFACCGGWSSLIMAWNRLMILTISATGA